MTPNPSFAIVLLAAGESERMKRPKALLDWHGLPLAQYQLQQAQATSAGRIVVVLGHEAGRVVRAVEESVDPARTLVVVNEDYRAGKTSSITRGLRALVKPTDAMLILAVDQPRPAAILARLAAEHVHLRPAITMPIFRGASGHPPVFDAALWPELLAIDEATLGLRAVVERHRAEVHELPFEDSIVMTNLNTRASYRRAKSIWDVRSGAG